MAQPNPMNNLVPYLDLFSRLGDVELARLAGVDPEVCASLRLQVDAINDGLATYVDLLPRLSDDELVRLTGASDRTIRFWRLCQPRVPVPETKPPAHRPAPGDGTPTARQPVPTAPHEVATEQVASDSGHYPVATPGPRDASGYVSLSGAPFPGFDDEADALEGLGGISLRDVEKDPLGIHRG